MSEPTDTLINTAAAIAADAALLVEAAENIRLYNFTPANGGPNSDGMVTLTLQGQQIVVASRAKLEADGLRGDKGDKGDQGDQGPAGNINAADASVITSGTLDPARLPSSIFQAPFVVTSFTDLTTQQQADIRPGSVVITLSDGKNWFYRSGAKTSSASYEEGADRTPTWSVIADKPLTFPTTIPLVDGLTTALNAKSSTGHVHDWSSITDKPNVAIRDTYNQFLGASARNGTGGYVSLTSGTPDWTGYVEFHHANGNRAAYIGFANKDGNNIRLAAEGAGAGFSFSHRPDFNGAVPWDSLNLPGPATTNTVQQFNARKVFKGTVGGLATATNYADRPLEVQALAASDDALMSFHIPGVRANTFGMRVNGDWVVGGLDGQPKKLWHEGNLDPTNRPGLIVNGTPTSPSGLTFSFDSTGHAEIQSYASRNLLINRLGNGVGINRSSVTGGFALDVGGNTLLAGTLLLGDKATLNGGAVMPTGKVLQSRAGNYATRAATNIAQYRYAGPNLTGAIVFKSSSTLRFIMQRLRIEGYLYETGNDIDLSVGFYNYTPDSFHQLTLNQRGTTRPRVRIGYDAAGNTCVIIGDFTTTWAYPHLVISEALLSHTDSDTYLENWTSTIITSLTGYTSVTDITDSGAHNALATKQLEISASRDLPTQFTMINGDGIADTRASFRGSYAIGVSKGGGGHFYLGATSASSPTLVFYRVDGAEVASLSPTGLFSASGGLATAGTITEAGSRVWTAATFNPASKADSSHGHTIAQVTGLQTALDSKQASLGFTPQRAVTNSQGGAPSGGVDGDVHIVW